jgi:crossover junction endodeoxyribonuclease RuvC
LRILGIDCGSVATGYGIIDSDGVSHSFVDAGEIRSNPSRPFAERLLAIAERLRGVIALHHPDAGAVEDVFTKVNARSALKLAQVRGVALLVLAEAGLSAGEYSPAEVKQSVTGHGRAAKEQLQWMIPSLLKVAEAPKSPDACDALAVAVCHAVHLPVEARR